MTARLLRGYISFLLMTILTFSIIVYNLLGSTHYVRGGLPKYGTSPSNPKHSAIIQLHRNGKGFCSAVVIDANYALTAAHCVVDDFFGNVDHTQIVIKDASGNDTGTVAKVAASHGRIDIAMLIGDFNNFHVIEPDFYEFSPTNALSRYSACGFPGLQNKVTCTNFVPTHNDGFSIAGKGFLIPGMSGGPVIDIINRKLIAVNSAASTNGTVLVAPVLGILGAFGVEQ